MTTDRSDTEQPPLSRWGTAAAIAGIFLYTLVLCVPAAFRFDGVSLYDEITHFDYAYKLTVENSIPRSVEPLSDASLEVWACRDSDWVDDSSDLCERTEDRQSTRYEFPVDGVNYNGFHPVGYYAITGWGAQALSALAGPVVEISLFSAMRIMSGLWLAAGISAFYLLLKKWLGAPGLALSASLLLVSLPAITLFGFTISPDAAAPLAGAAALAIVLRMVEGRPAFLFSTVLTFLVAGTKLLSIVAILSVVSVGLLYSLAHVRNVRGPEFRRWSGPFAGALLGTGLSYAAATALTRSAGSPVVDNPAAGLSTLELGGSPLRPVVDSFATHAGLVNPYWMPAELNSPEWAVFSRLIVLLIIASPFVLMWTSPVKSRDFVLGLSLIAGTLTVPILIQVRELLTRGEYFANVAPRYSISLVPLAIACIAIVAARRSWGALAMWVLAGLAMILGLGSINGIFTV